MPAHVSTCHVSPAGWCTIARSPYLAACLKKTPTVVRSSMASGSRSLVEAVEVLRDVALFDRLDRERQRAGRHADCDLVALLAADERPSHRRVDRDAPRRRVALDCADQVVGLGGAVGV